MALRVILPARFPDAPLPYVLCFPGCNGVCSFTHQPAHAATGPGSVLVWQDDDTQPLASDAVMTVALGGPDQPHCLIWACHAYDYFFFLTIRAQIG